MEDRAWVPVEFYVPSGVLSGFIYISSELRLLDLLNGHGQSNADVSSDYIEFMNSPELPTDQRNARFVRKAAIGLAAIGEANLARGSGGKVAKVYPFAKKSLIHVSVQTPAYILDGTMHSRPDGSIRETLDERTDFLPLTDVTMYTEGHFYGERPFVAARKDQIIFLKEETTG